MTDLPRDDNRRPISLQKTRFGVVSIGIVIVTGVVVIGVLIWASDCLVGNRGWWTAAVSVTTGAVLLLAFTQPAPKTEIELMRAQVLRR